MITRSPLPTSIIAGQTFFGPIAIFNASNAFAGIAGIYIIASQSLLGSRYLDVGESSNIGERLASHDRRDCWNDYANGPIVAFARAEAMTYQRLQLERYVRSQLIPICGTY